MRRTVWVLVCGLLAFSGVYAAASTLEVGSSDLGAGSAQVSGCDDSVTLAYSVAYSDGAYRVTSVDVGDIAPACVSQRLDLVLRNNAGTAMASGSIASLTSSATQTVTFSPPLIAAADVEVADVAISG